MKKIEELFVLTNSALSYAEKKDIAQVTRCLRERAKILEKLQVYLKSIPSENRLKILCKMNNILKKDEQLNTLLREHKEALGREKKTHKQRQLLKLRFADTKRAGFGGPNFIDKKV